MPRLPAVGRGGEESRPCNHIYISRKPQPCLSRLNGMGGELPSSSNPRPFPRLRRDESSLSHPFPVDSVFQLDHAAHAARSDSVCLRSFNVIQFSFQDLFGKIVVDEVETSRHPAAAIRLFHLHELHVRNGLQQLSRFLKDLHASSQMAGIMVGDPHPVISPWRFASFSIDPMIFRKNVEGSTTFSVKDLTFLSREKFRVTLLQEIETRGTGHKDLVTVK